MSRRKPPDTNWQSWTEHLIQEAQENGQFEHLPGFGKPLVFENPHDEQWWLREKLREEQLQVPSPAAEIRRDYEQTLERLSVMECRETLRKELAALNERVRLALYRCQGGPPCRVTTVDINEYLRSRKLS